MSRNGNGEPPGLPPGCQMVIDLGALLLLVIIAYMFLRTIGVLP